MPANARIKAPCALLVFNAANRLLPGAEAVVASAMQEESTLGLPHQAGFQRGVVGRIAGERCDASVQSDEGRVAYEDCVIDWYFPFELDQHAQRRTAREART
jgi:hypothetical protein